jgi:hypothetical protein
MILLNNINNIVYKYNNDKNMINFFFDSYSFNNKSLNIHIIMLKFLLLLLKIMLLSYKNNIIKQLFFFLQYKKKKLNIIQPLYLQLINNKRYKLNKNFITNYLLLIINKILYLEIIKIYKFNLNGVMNTSIFNKLFTILKSPLSDKKSRNQYFFNRYKYRTYFPFWLNSNLIFNFILKFNNLDYVGNLINIKNY